MPATSENVIGRERELQSITRAWHSPKVRVFVIVAPGGLGKSALVNRWLGSMRKARYRGAKRVFGWSFYTQGLNTSGGHADEFLENALTWFGVNDFYRTPSERGYQLAECVRRHNALVVLDGLEPLQAGATNNTLMDPGISTFLTELATSTPSKGAGLCVITTRVPIANLSRFEGESLTSVELPSLSKEASTQLLRQAGVTGTAAELTKCAVEYGGHPLALSLLATFLRDAFNGDVRRSAEVPLIDMTSDEGSHAFRVISSYEKWFGDKSAEVAILRLLSLFDRPADYAALQALQKPPVFEGLNSSQPRVGTREWTRSLKRLTDARLVSVGTTGPSSSIDVHPLVRQYFAKSLSSALAEAWREGNTRRYRYLRDIAVEVPSRVEHLAPLYSAVAHACQAELFFDALHDVYIPRIAKGEQYYSTRTLGAFAADLAVFACFFKQKWSVLAGQFSDEDTAYIFSQTAFRLRAIGHLFEAIEPFEFSLESYSNMSQWHLAAPAAGNLSQVYSAIGSLRRARLLGERAVELGHRSSNPIVLASACVDLASALHQSNDFDTAHALFLNAESAYRSAQPEINYLHSVRGFLFCDFLIDKGNTAEVEQRAAHNLEGSKTRILDHGLDNLALGRALLQSLSGAHSTNNSRAGEHLQLGVQLLRAAGRDEFVPVALISFARFHRLIKQFAKADQLLAESTEISKRGGMTRHLVDTGIERLRLLLDQNEVPRAVALFAEIKEQVWGLGYLRRLKEIEELEPQMT